MKDIMPEISKFYGIIIYMYIDDHNPPHFHVWYDEYKAEVTIKDGIVRGEMPRRALRLVYEWLDLHRDELMERSTLSLCLQRTGSACRTARPPRRLNHFDK